MSLDFRDLGLGVDLLEYTRTWELQRRRHAEVAVGTAPDTVFMLEHAEVYTAGRRTEPHERPVGGQVPVIEVDRGGKITWHGPGQLVVYPIVRLPATVGVVDYVRRLEEAMIALFAEYGLITGRVPGRSGVWLAADPSTGLGNGATGSGHGSGGGRPERKIAAIGVRVAAGTTMHGLAINVDPDMTGFGQIVPCGLVGTGVTSMAAELEETPSLIEVAHRLRPRLAQYLYFRPYEQSPDLLRRAVGDGAVVGVA